VSGRHKAIKLTVYAVILHTSLLLHLPLAHAPISEYVTKIRQSAPPSLRECKYSLKEDCKLFLQKIIFVRRKISAVNTHFEIQVCVAAKDNIPGSHIVMSNYDHRLSFRHYNVSSIAFQTQGFYARVTFGLETFYN
jgi:hypothetical protein